MSALYERSQLTQVMISSAPATAETMEKAEYLPGLHHQGSPVHRRSETGY